MKMMTKLLLVHWHYFTYELIELSQLNFLTGKNASGKSTIIDAIQVVLLGDASGTFFNKAATGKGNRTLAGYLRGELGDDEASAFKYLRNGRFTSYIAIEFYDQEKKRSFTAGCCFDTYSENDMQKLFFQYDGPFPENGFMSGNTPLDISALRLYLKESYKNKSTTTDVARNFRTHLYGKLGGLRDRFGVLLKKAVSFNPNIDIQDFISEFVCDPQQTVDVSQMQANIRSYKNLEGEADNLKMRIADLERIIATYDSYTTLLKDEKLYSYLVDRSQVDMVDEALDDERNSARQYRDLLERLGQEIERTSSRHEALEKERETLIYQLSNDEQLKTLTLLENQIAEKKKEINALISDFDQALALLSKVLASWKFKIEEGISHFNAVDWDPLAPELAVVTENLKVEATQLLNALASLGTVQRHIPLVDT